MALRFAEIISVDVIPYKGGNLLLNALRKFGFFQIPADRVKIHEHWIVSSLHSLPTANFCPH